MDFAAPMVFFSLVFVVFFISLVPGPLTNIPPQPPLHNSPLARSWANAGMAGSFFQQPRVRMP
jgi:hypothetical protein